MGRNPSRRLARETRSKTERPLAAVVLAAGEGTRMKSRTAKVLHRAAGRSLVEHVVDSVLRAGAEPVVVVVGAQADAVERHLRDALPDTDLRFASQPERLGTADAVLRARRALGAERGRGRFTGDVLIVCGDVPALPASALRALVSKHRGGDAALSVLTAIVDDPRGYGRIVRGEGGGIRAIVEHGDASPAERKIHEVNSGTYCAGWPELLAALDKVKPDNTQGELYLTDAVRLLLGSGSRVNAVVHPDPEELVGVNTRRDLGSVGRTINRRTLCRLMDAGVTVIDPETTWVDVTVRVGRDSILHPGVTLEGRTKLGSGCVVRSGVRLHGVSAGRDVEFLDHTVATESVVGDGAKIGPFAHLRPATVVGPECKVGNFVETKKTTLGRGSKASHLSYLGDAVLGSGVNVGAGTITCNYDGVRKHETRMGDGVFIGSDTQLVAPVRLGKGAYVAAGTTVTKDVPPGSLAISRASQRNIEGWVERRRNKSKKENG